MPTLKAALDCTKGQANDFRSAISTIEEIQANLKPRYPVIGARELQVAERVKAGLSARRIAAELGIAETTVNAHRNSVYVRFGWQTVGSCYVSSLAIRGFRSDALIAAPDRPTVVQ